MDIVKIVLQLNSKLDIDVTVAATSTNNNTKKICSGLIANFQEVMCFLFKGRAVFRG